MNTNDSWDDIKNMVTDIAKKNMIDVEHQFSKIMGDKVNSALSQRQVEVANSIYGSSKIADLDSNDEEKDLERSDKE